MPRLEVFRLQPSDLSWFREFRCGDEPRAQEVAEWIRGEGDDSVLAALADPTTEIWFYATPSGQVVGFSSLGQTRWRYPDRDHPAQTLSIIPMLGVHIDYHGKPADGPKSERYSRQILRHVIGEAKAHADAGRRSRLLGLYVHPENRAAIGLYAAAGFQLFDRQAFSERTQTMYSCMLLVLP